MSRLKPLDVVRGLAILLVLVYHYLPRTPDLVPPLLILATRLFWSGVDLFFVLSGFLIGGILLSNKDKDQYFQTFYIRRAARILPLYLLICGILVVITQTNWISGEEALRLNSIPIWSYLTFTQNFWMALNQKFSGPWLDVSWSLAIEEQFYIFLPLLIRYTSKKTTLIVSLGLILLAPIFRLSLSKFSAYVLPFARADAIMLGVLLALVWQSEAGQNFLRKQENILRWSFAFLLAGVAGLIHARILEGDALGHFWLALLYCNLVILALISSSKLSGAVFNNPVMEWLGLRSYGIYLLHRPVEIAYTAALAALSISQDNTWLNVLLMTVILFGLTELSYRFFETPILELGRRFKYRSRLPDPAYAAGQTEISE